VSAVIRKWALTCEIRSPAFAGDRPVEFPS
jgi:hypothetical protein